MGLKASKKNRASSSFEEIGWSGISIHPNAAEPQVKGERVKDSNNMDSSRGLGQEEAQEKGYTREDRFDPLPASRLKEDRPRNMFVPCPISDAGAGQEDRTYDPFLIL